VEDSQGNPSIFANINNLEMGTIITINDNGTAHHYSVTEILTVDAADLSVVYPTNRERVTLITCTGYDFFSDSYQQRIVVVGERVEGELPDPAF
jgi:LPXTG-site transpeptidase (sortase) family protein